MFWLIVIFILLLIVGTIITGCLFEVEPMKVVILRDRTTGKLKQKGPGLKFKQPTEEIYREFNCRRRVGEFSIGAITSDAQKVTLAARLVYFIDALDKDGKEKTLSVEGKEIPRGVIAARNLPEVEEKKLIEEIEGLAKEVISTNLKKYISNLKMSEIQINEIPKSWEKDRIPRCPKCGSQMKVDGQQFHCSNDECKWSGKTKENSKAKESDKTKEEVNLISVNASLLELLSWLVSVESDKVLSDTFGIGTEFVLLYQEPPSEIAEAKLAEQEYVSRTKAEQERQKLEEVRAGIIKAVKKETGIPSWLLFLAQEIPSIIKEIKEKGGEKDEDKSEEVVS